jgi:hypothetical protein
MNLDAVAINNSSAQEQCALLLLLLCCVSVNASEGRRRERLAAKQWAFLALSPPLFLYCC